MKNLYALVLLSVFITISSKAQFSGSYAPAQWSTNLSPGSDGTVNTAAAPSSITITGSDGAGGSNVDIDYVITATAAGIWSFNWVYHSNDADASPAYDIAGIVINGAFTQLSDDGGSIDQSGSYTAPYVTAGTVIGFRIRATDNQLGDATLAISSFSRPGGILPLKLTSFSAKKEGGKVILQWKSENEVNVSHFETERSSNGSDFGTIKTVAAQNANQQYYVSADETPGSGVNYYRLRMVDRDGKFNYSAVVSVKFSNTANLNLYPNPANNQLTVNMNAENAGDETVSIYDAAGRVLQSQSMILVKGINKKVLDISLLSKGIYFIKLEKSGLVQPVTKD